jgi:ATP-dependent DNA helicase RecG
VFIGQLNQSIGDLKGVGKQIQKAYAQLGVFSCKDLLLLPPRAYEDRTALVPLHAVEHGGWANTVVEVLSHSYFGMRGKRTLKVLIKDISGEKETRASLLCFGRNFLERVLRVGSHFYLWGQFQLSYSQLQSSSFEMLPLPPDGSMPADFGTMLALYPLSGALNQRLIRRHVSAVLKTYGPFEEELPAQLREKHHLLPINEALVALHLPKNGEEASLAQKTFSYIELFYLLLMNRRKLHAPQKKGESALFTLSPLQLQFIKSLPFELTADQNTVLHEIGSDLQQAVSMNRLLQGDVGSGKTLIAWVSALQIIQQGQQVAFMAPTELLARQHAEQAAMWLEPLGVRLAFLTGSVTGKRRKLLLEALQEGQIDIIIGTHALFSHQVAFANLRYIIIDEQHRFGVIQRAALLQKGKTPDVLMMTATPIPRTLALTVYADMEISTIKTMPIGRLPVTTYLVSPDSRQRMYRSIAVEFERGHQAYFVYPRIDDQGESDLRDVESMFAFLTKEMYPEVKAALIHSRLPEEEKVEILSRFRAKELMFLVSTSVVEVGIDIPTATCMVIEHAERFGLAALHQLRGRVGRSNLQSYCFLVYEANLNEDAIKRLKVMKESNDGFFIAEQDLLIRGPGEVAGTRQSGFLKLRFASLSRDLHLIEAIKEDVEELVSDDPGLVKLQNTSVRTLLATAPPFEEQSLVG